MSSPNIPLPGAISAGVARGIAAAAEVARDVITDSQQDATVRIYTRLGAGNDSSLRRVSIRIPEGLDPLELLDLGFAIDGNEAVFDVAYDSNERAFGSLYGWEPTLNTALASTQKRLVIFLREKGFVPQLA